MTVDIDLADVLEHLNEGFQLIGPDFRYLFVNNVAATQGQRSRDELLGRTMMECYPGIEQTEMFALLSGLLADGGAHSMENEFAFPDGSRRWFELRMARVPQGVLILSIDISERKSLEAQVRRMHRMDAVGQLAGGVAHDFNNLLTVVQSYACFIRDDLEPSHPSRDDAEQIMQAARRGGDLTHRLLAFARQLPSTESGRVEVGAALSDLELMLRRTIGEHVALTFVVPTGLGSAAIAPSELDQIVVNLVVNARDAMEGEGSIVLELDALQIDEAWVTDRNVSIMPGEYLVLSVSDDGQGMSREVLDQLFEPFFTTKREGEGTGLGLSTCWGLVGRAGGTITVYSEPGKGTTFRVYLPRATEAHQVPAIRETTATAGRGERILVVEDEAAVREIVARALRAAGYRAIEASSAAEALTIAEELGGELDLLLTDVVMPQMSGLELADQLRGRFPALRVVLVSGFTPRSLEHRGVDPREFPMLVKPFTPGALLRGVRGVLDAPR
ncbi:MAG: response regulator [Myxococcales bacterium]|nr:response regulator [Myxococcales bacterium]